MIELLEALKLYSLACFLLARIKTIVTIVIILAIVWLIYNYVTTGRMPKFQLR